MRACQEESAGVLDFVGQSRELVEQCGNGVGKVVRRAGQADFNVRNVANEAVADDFRSFAKLGKRALP